MLVLTFPKKVKEQKNPYVLSGILLCSTWQYIWKLLLLNIREFAILIKDSAASFRYWLLTINTLTTYCNYLYLKYKGGFIFWKWFCLAKCDNFLHYHEWLCTNTIKLICVTNINLFHVARIVSQKLFLKTMCFIF